MITQAKLKVYKYYNGDIDDWALTGSRKQKDLLEDADWFLVDSLIQDIKLVKKGLASKNYADNLHSKLLEVCDSQETIDEIKKIASKS